MGPVPPRIGGSESRAEASHGVHVEIRPGGPKLEACRLLVSPEIGERRSVDDVDHIGINLRDEGHVVEARRG